MGFETWIWIYQVYSCSFTGARDNDYCIIWRWKGSQLGVAASRPSFRTCKDYQLNLISTITSIQKLSYATDICNIPHLYIYWVWISRISCSKYWKFVSLQTNYFFFWCAFIEKTWCHTHDLLYLWEFASFKHNWIF